MVVVDVPSGRIQKQAIRTTQLPAGAFGQEARARQAAARELSILGQKAGALGSKLQSAEDLHASNAALLAAQQYDDKFTAEMLRDTEYSTQPKRYGEGFDLATTGFDDNMSKAAREVLTARLAAQRSGGTLRAESNAFRSLTRQDAANQITNAQRSVAEEAAYLDLDDPDIGDKARAGFRRDFGFEIQRAALLGLVKPAGPLSVQGRWRTRSLIKGSGFAARSPEDAVDMFASRESLLKEGIFDKTEVDSLTDEDIGELKEAAEEQIDAREADAKNARKEANEKIARDLAAQLAGPDPSLTEIQAEFRAAIKSGALERTQITTLEASIKSHLANAGKKATVEQRAASDNNWAKAFHAGKFDEAEGIALKDAWMYATPGSAVTRGRLEKIAAARNKPEIAVNDTLDAFIDISNDMATRMIEVSKARTDESELDEEGARKFARDTAKIGLEQESRDRQMRAVHDQYIAGEIDAPQMRTKLEAIVLPAQEQAAKDVTMSIWEQIRGGLRLTAFRRPKEPRVSLGGKDESAFQEWYAKWAKKTGIDPDPDDPRHKYDYRAAFRAGVEPSISSEDNKYHWPSQFKDPDHPNRFVGGIDTISGKQVTVISTQDEYNKLASGTRYKDADGNVGTKP
ncbi:MAG: hypothetical protein V3W44_04225 [Dehalococcoidales bacterium]